MATEHNVKYSLPRVILLASTIAILVLTVLKTTPTELTFLPYGKLSLVPTEPIEFETTLESVRFVGKTGNVIDNSFYYVGGWETFELHALRDLLTERAGSNGVFLDIGANIGVHSIYMSRHASKVVSIEPFPPVLERFHIMKELNHSDNIRIFPVGYSNNKGTLPFYAPPESNLGTGSFDESFSSKNQLSGFLPLVIGDEHLKAEGINRIDLIKVDIEGYERYALLGLAKTLEENRPIVAFELNVTEGGFTSKDELIETFPEGYNFYYIDFDLPQGTVPYYSIEIGSYVYVFGPGFKDKYALTPFDFSFKKQANLIAIPAKIHEIALSTTSS